MTIEEKAKAYDEVLQKAKEIVNDKNASSVWKGWLCNCFPELKESEDESIRKELIRAFKSLNTIKVWKGIERTDILAWLEKQGDNTYSWKPTEEQGKKIEPIEDFDTEFERQISHLIASIINKKYSYTKAFVKWTSNALLNYAKYEIKKPYGQRQECIDCQFNYAGECKGSCAMKRDEQMPVDNRLIPQKGEYYVCIKDYYLADGETTNTKGKIYKSPCDGYINNNRGFGLSWINSRTENFFRHVKKEELWELKKSEDERIRNFLIDYIQKAVWSEQFPPKKEILDWLEKQGEQKSFDYENANIQQKDFAPKVEPKFKVGDWVVNRINATIMQIVNNVDFYESVEINGERRTDTYNYVEWDFRLWTIQDAKDGDVIALNNEVFIYAHRKEMYSIAIAHCFVDSAGGFYLDGEFVYGEYGKTISPATKEQRDLLFSKMKEAGYEWDADKKELNYIAEPINGEDYGIDGLWHAQNILEKTLGKVYGYQSDDGILEHECAISAVKRLYEQKPAWSEEDEKRIKKVMHILSLDGRISNDELKSILDWLKSLRPQGACKLSKEQNSDGNVKPMFKIGDIIRHKEYNDEFKILNIEGDSYTLENNIIVSIASQDSWELVNK